MAKHTSTPDDHRLRAEVCDAIMAGLCDDADFGEPKYFSAWCHDHKPLLLSLFGGQGIGNLQRTVAFLRREALQLRRDPCEVMCVLLDGMDAGLPPELAEALATVGLATRTDLIRGAMLEPSFAKSVFETAPADGLSDIMAMFA